MLSPAIVWSYCWKILNKIVKNVLLVQLINCEIQCEESVEDQSARFPKHHGLFVSNYSQLECYDIKREAKKVIILQLCLPQEIWAWERLFAKTLFTGDNNGQHDIKCRSWGITWSCVTEVYSSTSGITCIVKIAMMVKKIHYNVILWICTMLWICAMLYEFEKLILKNIGSFYRSWLGCMYLLLAF